MAYDLFAVAPTGFEMSSLSSEKFEISMLSISFQ